MDQKKSVLILCFSLVFSLFVPAASAWTGAAENAGQTLQAEQQYDDLFRAVSTTDDQLIKPNTKATSPKIQEENKQSILYSDSVVFLYNVEQLALIGTNAAVTDADNISVGTGTVISDETGKVVRYSLSQTYRIASEIELPDEQWKLPDGFNGCFVGEITTAAMVYNAETDTIYIYHPYQLETIPMVNADK